MRQFSGIVASNGVAIGPAFRYEPAAITVERRSVADLASELERFDSARATVKEALESLIARFEADGRGSDAEIFEIQLEFLDDPTFGLAIREMIEDEKINGEAATEAVTLALVAEFAEIEDEYFAQRTADIEDLGNRIIRTLLGVTENPFDELTSPVVVFARDLTPSDTAQMDRSKLLALCTEIGSATSHTAILSRSLGIPAIVGTGPQTVETGADVIIDAIGGSVIIDADDETRAHYTKRKTDFDGRRDRLIATAKQSAVTLDGFEVEIAANIGSAAEARQAVEFGAEGVGLLRTEFLFLDRPKLPNEDEQYTAYRAVADIFGKRTVVVRTLDVGGDKQLPSVEMPVEENPFLGQRAIRLALSDPDRLLMPQLKALLRASVGRGIRIMFPMVATASEVRELKEWLDRARSQLKEAEVEFAESVEVGIMIEIPAAAINARRLAPLVDFFSIGTNDLTQYTMAVDRTNERVAAKADYFDPAVLDLIHQVILAGHEADIWVGMCGEMAGDPLALPLLLGMGLDEFSMAPASIPDAKDRLRHLDRGACRSLVEKAAAMDSALDVRELSRAFIEDRDD